MNSVTVLEISKTPLRFGGILALHDVVVDIKDGEVIFPLSAPTGW